MDILQDRTAEVESRLRAIHVDGRDCCGFWKARTDAIVKIQQCWYCAHSQFDRENPEPDRKGLCKYKW